MTEAASKILKEALRLDEAERAKIAGELLSSLEDTDEQVHESWAREIQRRAAEARVSGAAEDEWRLVLNEIERETLSR
ncbi:MAG: addiction module protein [Acidobacteria bacterium]|nr:addiction module protein [Acidobacteriota bacterium]